MTLMAVLTLARALESSASVCICGRILAGMEEIGRVDAPTDGRACLLSRARVCTPAQPATGWRLRLQRARCRFSSRRLIQISRCVRTSERAPLLTMDILGRKERAPVRLYPLLVCE